MGRTGCWPWIVKMLIKGMLSGSPLHFPIHQFTSVTQSCLTLCDPMDCSTPGLPVHHQLPESTQAHVHWVSDAIQTSHPLYKSAIIYLLTWDCWLVINSNLLVFLSFFSTEYLYILAPPLPFQSSPSELSERLFPRFKFSASLTNKTYFQSICNAGDPSSIPGSGRQPGEGHGNPPQYSCLENSMDRWAWWATVHGIT